MTSATSRPSGVETRVCQIMVRRPRWTGVASPITLVPIGAGATKLVLLSIVVGPGTLWQVDDCAGGAEGVGERHDGTAVKHCRAGTEILAHDHLRDDFVRRGADELDAEQFGKGQHLLTDAGEQIHSHFS